MSKIPTEKIWGTIVGIIAFIALIAGLTYAYFAWASSNTSVSTTSKCFTINYTNGTNIGSGSGSPTGLSMSTDYTGGLYTDVKMSISSSCSISGTGTISLTTSSFKYSNGTSAVSLISGGTTLKYAVATITNNTPSLITGCSGSITAISTKDLCTFNLTSSSSTTDAQTYRVYVWVDGSNAGNSFSGVTYSGYISASAAQAQV